MWKIYLMFSIFAGFMVATTVASFFPSLRMVVKPALCREGELIQQLPISNKRLNLFCRDNATGEERRVSFFPYLIICTAVYSLILALPVSLAVRGANAYLEAKNPVD